MAQVTYTVGLLDAASNVVYSGTLEIQMAISNLGPTPQAAVLSLGSLQPLLLVAVSGSGQAWSFYGSNSSLSVQTTSISPTVQPFDAAPTYLAGSIALTPAGKPQQNLLILGFEGSPAPAAAAPRAASEADALGTAAAFPGIPPAHYNFTLQLLDTSFAAAGTGTFSGTGQEVQMGPVSRQWSVNGSLVLNGGEAVSIQGWGTPGFWYGRGTASGGEAINLGFVPQTFISGSADGTITVGAQTSFFVGTSVAASTVPVQGIGAPAESA